jgi:hypothetical protein
VVMILSILRSVSNINLSNVLIRIGMGMLMFVGMSVCVCTIL